MSADVFRFVAVAAAFIENNLVPHLAALLAEDVSGATTGADRDALRASLALWIADLKAGPSG